MTTEERIAKLEFQTELLFSNTECDRFIYESGITRTEYRDIMDLMDTYRSRIDRHEEVSSAEFESNIYEIVPSKYGDYHFCEGICKAFADSGRWCEVFQALYGNLTKYGGHIE